MTPEQRAYWRALAHIEDHKFLYLSSSGLIDLLDALDAAEARILEVSEMCKATAQSLQECEQELDAAEARAERAEADADRLADDLRCAQGQWGAGYLWEKWDLDEALAAHDEAVKQRP